MGNYYRAGYFGESSVSDIDVCVNIPNFRCEVCGQHEIVNYYNYPQFDAKSVLNEDLVSKLGPRIGKRSSDGEIFEIAMQLRRVFKVPVTAGTIFGPTRLRVTSRPKADFYVLVQHAGLFCRRSAVQKLLADGLKIEFVESPASGKWASEAGYVELVVPVIAHQKLPSGVTFCGDCFRHTSKVSFPTVLIQPGEAELQIPFFKTIEDGIIIFHKWFIETAKRLSLTGFVDGKTILSIDCAQLDCIRQVKSQ